MEEHSPCPCEDPGSTPGPEFPTKHQFGCWTVPDDVVIKDEGWVCYKAKHDDDRGDSDYSVIMQDTPATQVGKKGRPPTDASLNADKPVL